MHESDLLRCHDRLSNSLYCSMRGDVQLGGKNVTECLAFDRSRNDCDVDGLAVASAYAQQNNWIEYYFLRDANVHCYYSPNSIERSGSTVRVKSYDSLPIPGSIA